MQDQKIDVFLLSSRIAIVNAIENPPIATMLADFGYDAERLNAGKELLENAEGQQALKTKEFSEQIAATATLHREMEEAKALYDKHYKIARIAFKDNEGVLTALQLKGRRKRSYSGWLEQSLTFYTNLLGNSIALEGMAGFNITKEKLEAGQKEAKEVEQAYAQQHKEKGEAQQATVNRDVAFDLLDDWLSDYLQIARLALAEKPQYMEALGIVV